MKNAFDGLISRLDTAEERTCDLEDVAIESSETKKSREQRLKKQMSRDCGIMTNHITDAWWDYQKEKKEKETEEIWWRSSLKLNSDLKPQIQEAQRTLSRINAKKTMPRSIIVKLQKIKDKEKKILKEARKKWKGGDGG